MFVCTSVDDAVPDCRGRAIAFVCGVRDVLPLGDAVAVDDHLGHDFEPRVFLVLRRELRRWVSSLASKRDQVTGHGAFRGSQELNSALVWRLSAEHHAVGGEPAEFLRLEVAKHDAGSSLHGLNGHKLLQAGSDLSDLSVSNVDFLAVKLIAFRMLPDLDDLADADVHLRDVRDDRRGWRLGLLLLLLLLFLFLGLLLAFGLFSRGAGGSRLLRLLLLLLLVILLLAAWLLLSTSLSSFGGLSLREFLHLRLGHAGAVRGDVWETGEQALAVDLVEHAWQVLDVVNPAEGVRQSKLLMWLKLSAKKWRQRGKHHNVSSCDVLANEEHALGHVRVDAFSEVCRGNTTNALDVLTDLVAGHRVSLAKEHVL